MFDDDTEFAKRTSYLETLERILINTAKSDPDGYCGIYAATILEDAKTATKTRYEVYNRFTGNLVSTHKTYQAAEARIAKIIRSESKKFGGAYDSRIHCPTLDIKGIRV